MNQPQKLKPCLVFECDKEQKKSDVFCSMHRARFARTGRFTLKSPYERMMDKVAKFDNGCFQFQGYRSKEGYGRIRVNGVKVLAHRHAWEHVNGPIPEGMLVCHKCDNPSRVNEQHLFLGTSQDNVDDCHKKGRRWYQK